MILTPRSNRVETLSVMLLQCYLRCRSITSLWWRECHYFPLNSALCKEANWRSPWFNMLRSI